MTSQPEITRQEVHREQVWRFTGHIEEGSAPDMRVKTRTTIRPNRVLVELVAVPGDEPHVEAVTVYGRRVLASGRMSDIESCAAYDRFNWAHLSLAPEWLRDYVKGLRT